MKYKIKKKDDLLERLRLGLHYQFEGHWYNQMNKQIGAKIDDRLGLRLYIRLVIELNQKLRDRLRRDLSNLLKRQEWKQLYR